ncbi:hypothetical protein [Streptomyces sp. NPDC048462]|uniref:hypothetical protein n=1 Tax=Streptomyces sp. NPDC048462 TaxID=3365555 RepID=UPI0037114883
MRNRYRRAPEFSATYMSRRRSRFACEASVCRLSRSASCWSSNSWRSERELTHAVVMGGQQGARHADDGNQ